MVAVTLPIILFFVLLFIGLPIAFAMGISGVVGLLTTFGLPATLGMLETIPYRTTASYTLTTVAMFVLMAELATQSGITNRLFDVANRFIGHAKGGLAIATIYASAGFGAISGSSVAAAATMSGIAIPEMRKLGYNKVLSAGVVAIAGTLAVMIPPSLAMIIYGIITETSIGKLLLAGIVPGLLTAVGHMLTVQAWMYFSPGIAPQRRPRESWAARWEASRGALPFLIVVVAVFACLYSGIITATEAGAAGAAVTLLVWLVGSRLLPKDFDALTWRSLGSSLDRALRTTTMILVLLIGAYFFSYYLTSTGMTQSFVSYISALPLDRYTLLIAILCVYVLLGLFLSQLEIAVLTLPLVFPIITSLGFDPVWFGVLIVKTVEIGLVTPPVGMNVYVVAGATQGVSAADGFKGCLPFILMDVLIIALLIAFPELALFIPEHSGIG